MKIYKFLPLLLGISFLSCEQQDKLGTLFLQNTSSCQRIILVGVSGDSLAVRKATYSGDYVYFANIYGTWSGEHHSYEMSHCAVFPPRIKSVLLDNMEYQLNDTMTRFFSIVSNYTKNEPKEEYVYEMGNDFIELIKQQSIK